MVHDIYQGLQTSLLEMLIRTDEAACVNYLRELPEIGLKREGLEANEAWIKAAQDKLAELVAPHARDDEAWPWVFEPMEQPFSFRSDLNFTAATWATNDDEM